MNLQIASNIRKFRRAAELSQEQLAERIGVTFQTVSKWERGESFPDITLLPALASFFQITVDTLLGVDTEREKEEIQKILDRCAELETHYSFDDEIPLLEEGLKRYPNSYDLMAHLANVLQNSDPARSIDLCSYILERCVDNKLRNWVQSTLCYAYFKNGERDKAIAAARDLPHYYNTSQDALRNFLAGDELLEHVQDNILIVLAYEFWFSVRKIRDQYTPDEQIALYQKSNAIYDAIYETDDVPFKLTRKLRNFQGMAEVALNENRIDEAFLYMKQAAECAVLHDKLPPVVDSKAMLFSCHPYDRKWESKPYLKIAEDLRHDFETEEFYKNVRDADEYHAILAILSC